MGLSMSLSASLVQTQTKSHRLSTDMRHALKLVQLLKSPTFPNALRGLEGFKSADEILKERGGVGVLIGGCLSSVWRSRGWKKLNEHKDVDVLVLEDYEFELESDFEGGVDWWLPNRDRIVINDPVSGFEGNVT